MNLRQIMLGGLGASLLLTSASFAQDGIAPLPQAVDDSGMQRITPLNQDPKAASMLTTHPTLTAPVAPALVAPAPTLTPPPAAPSPAITPFARTPALVPPPAAMPPTVAPGAPHFNITSKSPFAHAAPTGPEIPSAPHPTVATPVVGVDAVETSEPAPPTPPAPGADPVTEDAAVPTEFTSPMFDNGTDSGAPRKIVIRVLNKVTAQSQLFKAKPGETITFGRLQITAEMCRVSAPNSQTDYAGLLDIKEQLPGKEGIKPLFHGWMYASSPSVTALEHPIYDVSMVSCDIASPAPKEDVKSAKKPGAAKKK